MPTQYKLLSLFFIILFSCSKTIKQEEAIVTDDMTPILYHNGDIITMTDKENLYVEAVVRL